MCKYFNLTACLLVALCSCTNLQPANRFETVPAGYNLTFFSGVFSHWVIEHIVNRSSEELHVYIEGDGIPWLNGNIVNDDPTPENLLAFSLLQLDGENAIYLGRPCYFSEQLPTKDPNCNPHYWTDARYSQTVVDSMVSVLDRYARDNNYRKLVLFGYSGGGVIATMMACRMKQKTTLVTVAANLDVAAWTRFHDYSPLTRSLDPARDFSPCDGLTQFHFAASEDIVVPAATTKVFMNKVNSKLAILIGLDHGCCWREKWPEILLKVR
jgi:hypothetical protein